MKTVTKDFLKLDLLDRKKIVGSQTSLNFTWSEMVAQEVAPIS